MSPDQIPHIQKLLESADLDPVVRAEANRALLVILKGVVKADARADAAESRLRKEDERGDLRFGLGIVVAIVGGVILFGLWLAGGLTGPHAVTGALLVSAVTYGLNLMGIKLPKKEEK